MAIMMVHGRGCVPKNVHGIMIMMMMMMVHPTEEGKLLITIIEREKLPSLSDNSKAVYPFDC